MLGPVEQTRSLHEQSQAERESLAQQLQAAAEARTNESATLSEKLAALDKQVAQQTSERERLERELSEVQVKLSEALTQSKHIRPYARFKATVYSVLYCIV